MFRIIYVLFPNFLLILNYVTIYMCKSEWFKAMVEVNIEDKVLFEFTAGNSGITRGKITCSQTQCS